jgi:hypothetical protein
MAASSAAMAMVNDNEKPASSAAMAMVNDNEKPASSTAMVIEKLPTYYYGQVELGADTINIIIQYSIQDGKRVLIDVLKNSYIEIPEGAPESHYITSLIGLYGITTFEGFSQYPNMSNTDAEMYFKTFLAQCNPEPIIPVILGQTRYFYKDTEEVDEERVEIEQPGGSVVIEEFADNAHIYYDAPDILSIECKSPGTICKFINPITKEEYEKLPLETIYIEEKREEAIKRIERLVPITNASISNWESFFHSSQSVFVTLWEGFQPLKITKDILTNIEVNFAKHLSFDYPFINDDIKKIVVPESANNKAVAKSLNNQFKNNTRKDNGKRTNVDLERIKSRFNVVSFIRSYIDLYHDITILGKKYCPKLYQYFLATIPDSEDKAYLYHKISEINDGPKKIFTNSGEISQTKCKRAIDELVDEFIVFLHKENIKTNPIKKENALVMSASIENPTELNLLINELIKSGVMGFYIESANNDIGKKMLGYNIKPNGKPAFPTFNLKIGEWDAGSGFTGKKIGGVPDNIPFYPKLTMFGLYNIEVTDDNRYLKVLDNNDTELFKIKGPERLSVNRITLTTDSTLLRGVTSNDDSKIKKIDTIKTEDMKEGLSPDDKKLALISLKTWTDLIQIKSISDLMSIDESPKLLTVIYDGLCESTARLYGLGHVLKTEGKVVSYYNYNINSRKLDTPKRQHKERIQNYIKNNIPNFQEYLNQWFRVRIAIIQSINISNYDPVLYFVTELFKENYEIAMNKSIELLYNIENMDIRLVPDTIVDYIEAITSSASLLGDFFDTNNKFDIAIQRIDSVGTRGDINLFIEAYDFVKQQIVNTFSTADELKLRSMIAATFAYVFLKSKKLSQYLNKLESIKKTVLHLSVLKLSKNYTKPIIQRNFGVNTKYPNMYNRDQLLTSIQRIKILKDSGKLYVNDSQRLREIIDIQIACNYLLAIPHYREYIIKVSVGSTDHLIPKLAFSNIIELVGQEIHSLISPNATGRILYFGGKKLARTHKRKQKKRKTYKKRK